MTIRAIKQFAIALFLIGGITLSAQTAKRSYPEQFQLSQRHVDRVLSTKAGSRMGLFSGRYLAKGLVLANTMNGDTKYARVQLPYFNGAYLNIQVNGVYSTQVFILSDDKSVFYKTQKTKDGFTFIKCEQDEIVSE